MNTIDYSPDRNQIRHPARAHGVWTLKAAVAFMILLAIGQSVQTIAEVRLPHVFGSHMVLQREKPLVFWGWAEPNENVTVKLMDVSRQVQANDKGEWKAVFPAMKAGGPHTVTVSGSSTVTFEDIMIGEVWLCSGQSNMEMGIRSCRDGEAEIAAANYPGIRLLMVPNRWTPRPQTELEAAWKVCTPKTIAENGWGGFSAAAYYFGRELHQQLGVPVGLIDATWGGTRIESWTPPVGFASVPAMEKDYRRVQLGDPTTGLHQERLAETIKATEDWIAAAKKALEEKALVPLMPAYPAELLPPRDVQHATALYNGMIHPLSPFALRGAIWYQGESNNGEGMLYADRMKALIEGWRRVWDDETLSFYFVQIAPYNYGGNPEPTAELWEAQTAAQAIPRTGMVVVNDIGDLKDIHPTNKQDVGKRLARWALAKDFGRSNLVYSGPAFKSMSIEGSKLRLAFNHVGGGLASRDGKPLSWFEVIDADQGGFVPAKAEIDGDTVVLSSPEVQHPVAMRFAWSMLAEPNLMNAEGLPAGAFRAGQVPHRDLLEINVPEAKDYQLVYDLDLAKLGSNPSYAADNRDKITRPFDRIAYFMELQLANGESQYLFVSMDAFTADLGKIAVPTAATRARFQQNVANMNVLSNVKGIVSGKGLRGGNIEFWPGNYGTGNSGDVPNASADLYDFGDQPSEGEGYGCMQVHNHDARQTLFALNHWSEDANADIGIGNSPGSQRDWTFSANAKSYLSKRLRVLVRCK